MRAISVWFVTGASRGFGAEIVGQALAAGHQVVRTARDPQCVSAQFPDAGDPLLAVALDVTDEAAAVAAVRGVFDTNVFGVLNVLR
jgi:NAD(P)-dependent dehydrogenase (short-subunit alcohol dehydrogenase family)